MHTKVAALTYTRGTELIKKIDPKYDDTQNIDERIKITCIEYPNTGEEIKAGGTKYEIEVKVEMKSEGKFRSLIAERTLLKNAVGEMLQALEEHPRSKPARRRTT